MHHFGCLGPIWLDPYNVETVTWICTTTSSPYTKGLSLLIAGTSTFFNLTHNGGLLYFPFPSTPEVYVRTHPCMHRFLLPLDFHIHSLSTNAGTWYSTEAGMAVMGDDQYDGYTGGGN